MSIPQQITEHLEDYLDGNLSQAGRDQVTSWMEQSEENSKEVAGWFLSEVQMLEATRLADMRVMFESMTYDVRADQREDASPGVRAKTSSAASKWFLIAASVLCVLAGAQLWRSNTNTARRITGVNKSQASPAILGRLANCVWADGMNPIHVGQNIGAGTLVDVKSGLVQLVFENGAEVVLKGPCQLQVESSMLCRLFSGNVSAEVPHAAAGFTIRGPSSEVIDLGTRFGFSVGTAGKSEVHVFQGEVISRELNDEGEAVGDDIRLKTNQAVLYPGQMQKVQRLAANEAKFALEVKPLWRRDKIEPLVVDRKLVLWLRAEHGVQTDRKNRVVAWQDIALGSNRISNDAFQPNSKARPKYISDAIGGRPALRFDGAATCLATTPMTTTDNQTIVVVFQYSESKTADERIGGQIVNYNGPPSRHLPDVNSPGVLQLGEKIDTWDAPPASIAAKAFVGHNSSSTNASAGVVVSKSLGYDHPHVATYVYNYAENSATLYVDGEQVADASAPTKVAVTSRKVIGKHGIFDHWYFCGDLGEVQIFNAALEPNEVKDLSRQLMNYYGINAVDATKL